MEDAACKTNLGSCPDLSTNLKLPGSAFSLGSVIVQHVPNDVYVRSSNPRFFSAPTAFDHISLDRLGSRIHIILHFSAFIHTKIHLTAV